MKINIYKIRDKKTGLFSRGGSNPSWTKGGKTWTNIGHVKNHLHQLLRSYDMDVKASPYKNAEIIKIEVDLDDCFSYDVGMMVDEMISKKQEQDSKAEQSYIKWVYKQEMETLKLLLDKHGMKGILK